MVPQGAEQAGFLFPFFKREAKTCLLVAKRASAPVKPVEEASDPTLQKKKKNKIPVRVCTYVSIYRWLRGVVALWPKGDEISPPRLRWLCLGSGSVPLVSGPPSHHPPVSGLLKLSIAKSRLMMRAFNLSLACLYLKLIYSNSSV